MNEANDSNLNNVHLLSGTACLVFHKLKMLVGHSTMQAKLSNKLKSHIASVLFVSHDEVSRMTHPSVFRFFVQLVRFKLM